MSLTLLPGPGFTGVKPAPQHTKGAGAHWQLPGEGGGCCRPQPSSRSAPHAWAGSKGALLPCALEQPTLPHTPGDTGRAAQPDATVLRPAPSPAWGRVSAHSWYPGFHGKTR